MPTTHLHPMPVIGEPIEHVLVDCVGPLLETKTGNQYMLTIMCLTTRFSEVIVENHCLSHPKSSDKVLHYFCVTKSSAN